MKHGVLGVALCLWACGSVSEMPDAPPDGGAFAIAIAASPIRIVQGMSEPATVNLTRTGYTGAVTVSVAGLPAGVTADPLTIGEGSDSGTLVLRSEATSVLGSGAMATVTGDGGGATPTTMVQVYVQGPRGSLDTTFNTTGRVIVPVGSATNGDGARGVAILPSGKIIVVGGGTNGSVNFAGAIALTADGQLDTTMFDQGKHVGAYTPGTSTSDHFFAATAQPDGKVVAAGYAGVGGGSHFFLVARFTTLGVLDTTFGINSTGFNVTDFDPNLGDDAKAYGVGLRPDGSVLLGGFYFGTQGQATTARYTNTGALVGRLPSAHTGYQAAVGARSDNRVISVGGTASGAIGITRYTATDELDTTFGNGTGMTTAILRPTGNDVPHSVIVLPDNRFYVGAYSRNGAAYDAAVVRFTETGMLDTTFGSGTGYASTPQGNDLNDRAAGMALHPDDGSVILAFTKSNTSTDFAWVRVKPDGSMDPVVSTDFSSGADIANAVAVQPDGRIVVVGPVTANGRSNFGVARFWP